MKKLLIATFISLIYSSSLFAAYTDTAGFAEISIRDKILGDIQQTLNEKNRVADSTITRLDVKLNNIDSLIKMTGNSKEKMDKLVERVKLVEDKQKALEENELNVYQANYQSAIINLASMDREIKPLILFHSTKDFFETLSNTSNPSNYDGYKEWFKGFKKYIEKNKKNDATLAALDNILTLSGNVSVNAPLYGTVSELLCGGMASYINTIRKRNKPLREQSQQMFTLTMTLSQFNNDKDRIEQEWDEITKSLGDMQVVYDSSLSRNLHMLGCNEDDFNYNFVNEKDANRRYLYLSDLRQKAADLVSKYKKTCPKDWKDNIYYQLVDVQNLKTRYGDITYRIGEHINKYETLVTKYKSDKQVGPKVVILKTKLDDLKSTFDQAYEPKDYQAAVVRMYKVM